MVKLPNGIPTDSSNLVAGNMTWLYLEVGLNHQQIISNQQVNIG